MTRSSRCNIFAMKAKHVVKQQRLARAANSRAVASAARLLNKIKVRYRTSHYRPVPLNLPTGALTEAEEFANARAVVDATRTNLAIAHDEFTTAWRCFESLERQITPHEFVQPSMAAAGDARQAYTPKQCGLCYKLRADVRHGPLLPHAFVPCAKSVRLVHDRESVRCFECGLLGHAAIHGDTS
jgi:hypothetical protein